MAATSHIHDELLQQASIFNGAFSIDWLLALGGHKATHAIESLKRAQQHGHLEEISTGTYRFCSRKYQEKLYRAISPEVRQGYHRKATEVLADEFGDMRLKEIHAHLLAAGNDLEGCRQLAATGDLNRKRFQFNRAHSCYRKVVRDLINIQGPEADQILIKTLIHYLKISNPADLKEIRPIVSDAIGRAESAGLKPQLAQLRLCLAIKEWTLSHYPAALKQYQIGWDLVEEIDDPVFYREVNVYRTFFQYWQGFLSDAVADYEKNAPEIEKIPESEFSFIAHMAVATCLGHQGHFSQGLGMMDVIRKHCLETGNINIGCNATVVIGHIFLEMGLFAESIRYFEEALEGAIRGHNQWVHVWSLHGLAFACFKTGKQQQSVDALKEYLRVSRESQYLMRPFSMMMELCREMELGNYPRIEGLSLEAEIRFSFRTKNVFIKGIAFYYQALLKKHRGHPDWEIHKSLKRSIQYLEQSGQCINLALSRLELARLMLKRGQQEQAVALARPEVVYLFGLGENLVPDDFRFLLRDRNNETELLKEIMKLGQELATFRNHHDLAGYIISTVNRLAGAERGAMFMFDAESGKLRLLAARNLTQDDVQGAEFRISRRIIKETARTRKGRVLGASREVDSKDVSIRSMICVPMILRDRVVGVLYHDNRIFNSTFQESDLEMLNFFAAQAAIALENAEAYQKLEDRYQKEKEGKRYFEAQYLEQSNFEEIVGRSQEMQVIYSHMESVARTDTAVLILGETGVGKELVARAIHQNSERKNGPFIRVNCSAFSETLIASELFGHEKGSFTGATDRRLGRFELADGGTLFLDEVGDIPLAIQVKLLRVLQNSRFERVGGQQTLHSNFRLMAATNKDLEKAVQEGSFRMDLYYRINGFPIRVPPLRKRKEDIPLLAAHFLGICAKKLNKKIGTIPAEDMDWMMKYHWPGNVRELENFIERGVILGDQTLFKSPVPESALLDITQPDRMVSHAENERHHIVRVLANCNWRVSGRKGAARILDLHPNTLRYRMKKLGIQVQRSVELANTPESQQKDPKQPLVPNN